VKLFASKTRLRLIAVDQGCKGYNHELCFSNFIWEEILRRGRSKKVHFLTLKSCNYKSLKRKYRGNLCGLGFDNGFFKL
jgi:hypothetical protein